MGKKAVSYLLHSLLILFSLFLLVLAVCGFSAGYADPNVHSWLLVPGLLLPVVLAANLLLFIWWAVRRKFWLMLIPLSAGLFNFNYIRELYQPFGGGSVDETPCLTVATLNVHSFRQLGDVRTTAEAMSRFFRNEQVDVLCLEEFVPARRFGMDSLAAVFDWLPHRVLKRDMALFSRYPIADAKQYIFRNTANSAMWADVMVGGERIRVVVAHLQTTGFAPASQMLRKELRMGDSEREKIAVESLAHSLVRNEKLRASQANIIRRIVDTTGTPVIVCGDLNSMPASYVYRTVRGNLTDGFVDCGKGYGSTFGRFGGLLRIDYIFYSDRFKGVGYDAPDAELSDHRPVIARLRLNPVK